jgi:hypothetical protein
MSPICLPGFSPYEAIALLIEEPDAASRRIELQPRGYSSAQWDWVGEPGAALGSYKVQATQGSKQAEATFNVRAAASPRMVALEPRNGPPGMLFRIALAGFQPRQTVALVLYRSLDYGDAGDSEYMTDLPPAQTDESGQVIYELHTEPDDLPARYAVVDRASTHIYRWSDDESDYFGLTQGAQFVVR